jgi:predicted RNase H-like HicB family nuclease
MGLHYDIVIELQSGGCYVASVKQLPGFQMEGPSPNDLEIEVQEAIRVYLNAVGRPPDGLNFRKGRF